MKIKKEITSSISTLLRDVLGFARTVYFEGILVEFCACFIPCSPFDLKELPKIVVGGAGYRSRYLSHAKGALYHLSYAPVIVLYGHHNGYIMTCV